MSNFQAKYKQKGGGANDAATGRMIRARQQEERRRDNRAAHYSRYRDVSASPETQVPETRATSSLHVRLCRWKLEKELKKKMDQKNKKPIFKVGVVHHSFYSPVVKDEINTPCHSRGAHRSKTKPSPAKRITRATQKRLEAKMAAAASAASQSGTSTATACATPSHLGTSATRPRSQKKAIASAKKVPRISFAPQTYAFKGPVGVQKMPMFGRFALSRDSLSESAHSCEEKPWPAKDHISASKSRLKNNSLVRENDVGRLSLQTSERVSSSKDSLVKENSMKISDLDSQTDASQLVDRVDSPVVESLRCPGSPSPAMFSPYVTTSRGKDSARRERRSRLGIGRTPPDEVPTKDTIMRSLNISVEEEERTAQYFKFILQREMERLNEVCAKWEKVKGEPGLTEDARYLINQAIGQTTLLMRKKFERFRSLVADCETGKGEMLVQCRDLQGFWDMTYVEVKNCDSRFQKLEQLRSNGWVEDEIVVPTKRPTGSRKKVAANKFTMNAKSSARSWILAKRKMMSQMEENDADVVAVRQHSEDPAVSSSTDRNSPRTVPRSAKRASLKITPKKTPASLLKKVQLSETTKNTRSPLTVMKISQMCKTPDIRLDETISYVNSDQIPGRGILKKADEMSTTDVAVAKSARKVDFNDDVSNDDVSNEHRTNENLENSIDLGRALARIDSYESDSSDDVFEPNDFSRTNITLRRVEKRLDFENESISETENTDTAESSTVAAAIPESFAFPPLTVTALSPAKSASTSEAHPAMTTKAPRRSTRIAELPKEENHSEDEPSTRRVLRNRSVSMNTPKKNGRRSIKPSSARKTFAELDSSTKENNDPQIPVQRKSLSESSKVFDVECHSGEPNKLRRSMRKSVRFNAEDCTACADSFKPVHPMTPHSRRSRKISLLGDDARRSVRPLFDGDLISFDSPAVPSRVRRSSQASRKSGH